MHLILRMTTGCEDQLILDHTTWLYSLFIRLMRSNKKTVNGITSVSLSNDCSRNNVSSRRRCCLASGRRRVLSRTRKVTPAHAPLPCRSNASEDCDPHSDSAALALRSINYKQKINKHIENKEKKRIERIELKI